MPSDRTMTVQQFEELAPSLRCTKCQHIGLTTYRNANNGGIRPHCPACQCPRPDPTLPMWLSQNGAGARKVKRPAGDPTTDEVWTANGNVCFFCGKTREECDKYGIGLTIQHGIPFCDGGEHGPLIPFCARCQQQSTAAQAETQRIRTAFASLEQRFAELQRKQSAVDAERRGV